MGEFVANHLFGVDAHAGTPPTDEGLKAIYHLGSEGILNIEDIDSSRAKIKSTAAADDQAGFNAELSQYSWWTSLPTASKAAFWKSALGNWGT